MQVIKRSGKLENVSFDKITARVKKLCYGLSQDYVDPIEIAKKVIAANEKFDVKGNFPITLGMRNQKKEENC